MRIIYMAHIRMPTERAHGIQIMKMCSAFSTLGNRVELVIPQRFNHLTDNSFVYYGERETFSIRKVFSFDFDLGKFGRIKFWIQYMSFIMSSVIYIYREKPDLVYVREITPAFLLSLLGINVVFEDHELPRSNLFIYKFFIKRIKKKIIVAYNLRDIYDKIGVKKNSYIVAPNGVDIDEFDELQKDKSIYKEFGIKKEMLVILYVGHFYPWKGVYTLLDSINNISKDAIVVLIGGTVENIDNIKNYITMKNIKRVVISGFAPHKKVIKFIKSADILVLPNTAKEKRSAMYTTPIKLFEYMASNVPIVASDLPSFSKYLKDSENSLLFKPDDPKDLAKKIDVLLGDSSKRETLSKVAYDQICGFTWRRRAEKILNFSHN